MLRSLSTVYEKGAVQCGRYDHLHYRNRFVSLVVEMRMNWFQRTYRNIRNRLFSKPLVVYRELEHLQCKYCNKPFWNGLFKDTCNPCLRRGIDWAIKQSQTEK